MNSKHRRTLAAVFSRPVLGNINWSDIEALLSALGADIENMGGSMVAVSLNGVRALFHRPHPQKETNRGAVKAVRVFLEEAGVEP